MSGLSATMAESFHRVISPLQIRATKSPERTCRWQEQRE
jgi:hypothetical protein